MSAAGDRRISFGGADNGSDREKRDAAVMQTGKYDRKALRARLEIEHWIDSQGKALYGLSEDDELDVEIDLDEIKNADEAERTSILKNLLSGAKHQSDVAYFIKTLIKKMGEANII